MKTQRRQTQNKIVAGLGRENSLFRTFEAVRDGEDQAHALEKIEILFKKNSNETFLSGGNVKIGFRNGGKHGVLGLKRASGSKIEDFRKKRAFWVDIYYYFD
ncbi:hypothetical protein DLM76_01080 [Leptospira yasudae]|nr:hypothetical protein DLM76_01080 [Leptospira yasudae]